MAAGNKLEPGSSWVQPLLTSSSPTSPRCPMVLTTWRSRLNCYPAKSRWTAWCSTI